jgi:hypothetical protein
MLKSNISQNYSDCNHFNRKKIILPKGCEYYSYITCIDCGSFIQWAQENPKIVEERSQRVLMIEQLLNTKLLPEWDKEFLSRIKNRRLLFANESKKYQQMLGEYKMN